MYKMVQNVFGSAKKLKNSINKLTKRAFRF